MRTFIATMFAATLALSPAAAAAQETNAANAIDAANTVAPAPGTDTNLSTTLPPTDNGAMVATDVPPVADPAMTADTAMPAERDDDRGFPWGVLGLLGLIGLLGRNRSSQP